MAIFTSSHPVVGLTAEVRRGAKPAGWGDEPFPEGKHIYVSGRQITAVAAAESGYPFGTIEVHGWYWDPRDLVIR